MSSSTIGILTNNIFL